MRLSPQEKTLQKEFTQWQQGNCFYENNVVDILTQFVNQHKDCIDQYKFKNTTRKLIHDLRGTKQSNSKRNDKVEPQNTIQLNALIDYIQRASNLQSYKLLVDLLNEYLSKAQQLYDEQYDGIMPGKLQNQSKVLENSAKNINISPSDTLETPSIYDVMKGSKSVIPVMASPVNESGVQESIYQHLLFIILTPEQLENIFSDKQLIHIIKEKEYVMFKNYYESQEISKQIAEIIEQMINQNDQKLFQFIETNISELEKTYELFKQKNNQPISQYFRLVLYYINSNQKLFKQTLFDYLIDYQSIKEEKFGIASQENLEAKQDTEVPTNSDDIKIDDLQLSTQQKQHNQIETNAQNMQEVEENTDMKYYITDKYMVVSNPQQSTYYIRMKKNKEKHALSQQLSKLKIKYKHLKQKKLQNNKNQINNLQLDNYKHVCQLKQQLYSLSVICQKLKRMFIIQINKTLCKQMRTQVFLQQTQ